MELVNTYRDTSVDFLKKLYDDYVYPRRYGVAFCLALSSILWLKKKWELRVKQNTILELDITNKIITEAEPDPNFDWLNKDVVPLRKIVESITTATKDKRVVGLVMKLGSVTMTFSQLQELRDAIVKFREAGKKTLCFTPTFNEFSSSTSLYWFATAFEKIYISQCGTVNVLGIRMDNAFLRGTLDKLGIVPNAKTRKAYKNALNMFTKTEFTKEHKESTEDIMNTFYSQFLKDVASGRKLGEDEVKKLFDEGPFQAKASLEKKLIDGIIYEDEWYDKVLIEEFKVVNASRLNLLYLSKYIQNVGRKYCKGKNKFALINITGTIMVGKSDDNIMGDSETAGSDTICKAIRQAAEDKAVKVIILRVNSPGGSYVASDLIAHEVVKAKEKGKKVVVSMGQYAASGGYFVSIYADKIVALPFTLTGSIGVLAGKFNTREMWKKIGINFDHVKTGNSADLYSSLENYDEENSQKVDKWLDAIYEDFTTQVSKGRNLKIEDVEAVAQGRVWMGGQGKERKLVDEFGGLEEAIAEAKKLVNLDDKATVKIQSFPRKVPFWKLMQGFRNSKDKRNAGVDEEGSLGGSGIISGVIYSVLTSFFPILKIIPLIQKLQHSTTFFKNMVRLAPFVGGLENGNVEIAPALLDDTIIVQ